MFATQILPETLSNDSEEENADEVVGHIFVDNNKFDLKRGETKIGRDSSMCSIVIENFTVSKVHAVIESEGVNDSFIYDVGSTNQTKLGKKVLKPHCRYKLDNNSILTLGNVTIKFIVPPDKSSVPDSQSLESANLDDLGDIFDLPTQVGVLQSNTPDGGYQKQPQNFHNFTTPNSVNIKKAESKTCNNEPVECKSDSQDIKSQTVFCVSPLENSHIFSLGTQCQIYAPPAEQNKCVVQPVPSVNDKNEITSLLDDGQDDVLCTFMSLHSPNEQSGLIKEMNIKTEIENLSQVHYAPTQAQVETILEPVNIIENKEPGEFLGNKDVVHDLSSRISCKPSVTSTPISVQVNLNHPSTISEKNGSSMDHTDEDFIKTQQFNVNNSVSNKEKQDDSPVDPNNMSQNEETQPYLVETLNAPNTSESKNIDEDFIFTQTFDMAEKDPQNEKTPTVIQETEDFVDTQIFDAENELRLETRDGSPKCPDRGIDSTLNLTQRNDEDDFIATQVFEETTDVKSSDRNESDDDEDFIATQKLDLPVKNSSSKDLQGAASAIAIEPSSPDLIAAETLPENFEDCISTQIFDNFCENPVTETREQISSRSKEKDDCSVEQAKVTDPTESSGDDTESDLEIIFEKTETSGKERSQKFIKIELCESSPQAFSEAQGNDDSNDSYIFELEPENNSKGAVPRDTPQNERSAGHSSDSDATDCEEIAVIGSKMLVKEEPKQEVEFDGAQVLTLAVPLDFAEKPSGSDRDWMTRAESPRFKVGSPLSLEMPNTQEIETTMNRMLGNEKPAEEENEDIVRPPKVKKTEVGLNSNSSGIEPKSLIASPIKRPLESNNAEAIPVKKFKKVLDRLLKNSEIQLSKLVQVHDIGQIQPGRTRNSLRNLTKETKGVVLPEDNINNELPTSRRRANPKRGRPRNQNGDITPYLTRGVERKLSFGDQKQEKYPNENQPVEGRTRVLRSSTRRATKSPGRNYGKTRRHSRTKDEEHFRSSCVKVVFTGFECQILERIIYELGGKKTNDLTSGEVVVAEKVRRTVKFLSAVGLGLPITSPQWLLSCKKEKRFLNPWNYILKDEESEEKLGFELKASLEKSKKEKLLKGFSIFATKSAKPPVKDLLAIVEFCGGTPLFDSPDVWPKNTIIVSCLEDKKCWPPPKLRNIKIVHYEFILSGVLKQKIDFKSYKLR